MKEVYDNRDVVTQIYELKDSVVEANEKADSVVDGVANAVSTANTAVSKANEAIATANAVEGKADAAQETADTAKKTAEDAQAYAEGVEVKTATAQTTADTAVANAATAQDTADLAEDKADAAQETADKGIVLVEIQGSASVGTLYTKTAKNAEVFYNIPLASQTQTGLMNAQTYQTLNGLNSRVSILENKLGSVYVTFASDDPTQTEITGLFTEKTGRAPSSGDSVKDIARGLAYEYDGTTWIKFASPVSAWSNEGAGVVKGTPASGAAGTLFAEEDGTGSVNGWDELNTTVTNNYSTLNATCNELATGVANVAQSASTANDTANGCYNAYAVTATEEVVSFSMTTAGGTTTGQGIPKASATQAGTITASDYTKLQNAQAGIQTATATLNPADWADNVQTVTVTGMTADAIVWVAPSADSFSDYATCVCRATAQGADSLTFTADSTPEGTLTVNVGWSA